MTNRYEDMSKNERFAAIMGNLLRMALGVAKDRIVKVDKLVGNCVYFKEGHGLEEVDEYNAFLYFVNRKVFNKKFWEEAELCDCSNTDIEKQRLIAYFGEHSPLVNFEHRSAYEYICYQLIDDIYTHDTTERIKVLEIFKTFALLVYKTTK